MRKKLLTQALILTIAFAFAGCAKSQDDQAPAVSEATAVVTEDNSAASAADVESSGGAEAESPAAEAKLDLSDGSYMVDFDTDSSMFHVNETMKGKALLTVTDGKGIVHLIMPSQNTVNLYKGLIADVEDHKEDWIQPTIETVTYEDGLSEEVNAFDVPVDVIGEEFDLALIGKKQVWYDHKVSISNPEPIVFEDSFEDGANAVAEADEVAGKTIEVSLEGGTGKVTLISPTAIREEAEGYLVTLEWSSKNYDYMIVKDEKYLPVEVNEHSIFEIPVSDINEPLHVIADTVAMSTPHEIEYVITFTADSMK